MSVYILNKYICAGSIVEAMGQVADNIFHKLQVFTLTFYTRLPYNSSTPPPSFTEAATGASEKLGCQYQETETCSSSNRVRLD